MHIINFLKKKVHFSFENSIDEFEHPLGESPFETLQFKELQNALEKAIEMLPENCKAIYLLSRNSGLSNKEIAKKLNISSKTVENQITIALRKIRVFLEKHWYMVLLFALKT